MAITFQIDEPFLATIDTGAIQRAALTSLQLFGTAEFAPYGITVTITHNKTLEQLNQQYRGINTPTDVLTFPNSPDPDFPGVDPSTDSYLGDIIIAYHIADAQAKTQGHTLLDEIILLTVHGTLHLLGFDHDSPERKKIMWAAQRQIMTALNLGHVQPTED